MSHTCATCDKLKMLIGEQKRDLYAAMKTIENRPGTPRATEAKAAIPQIKQRIKDYRADYEAHMFEVPAEPEKPRRILDVAKVKAKPEPKVKRVLIDADAMAQALAETATLRPETGRGTNVLPATGHCHTCDKVVSGQRRFCGLCLAKRSA